MSFVDLYLAWAGPNIPTAMATAAAVWVLTRGLRDRPAHWQAQLIMAIGGSALSVALLAIIFAGLGLVPRFGPVLGVGAGLASGWMTRDQA